jgi:hypothetical protein
MSRHGTARDLAHDGRSPVPDHPHLRADDATGEPATDLSTELTGEELVLVQEARLRDLLPDVGDRALEGSGVLVSEGRLYVIFDNTADIGVVGPDLGARGDNHLIEQRAELPTGYEDIARDPITGNHYVVIESRRRGKRLQAWVEEFDADFRHLDGAWLDFDLPAANKGIEGLSCVHRSGVTYLLAMCEGNFCRAGAEGRRPGGGRVHVFRRGRKEWRREETIELPAGVAFVDYSSLSVRGERITVASQESSALWVSRLLPDVWRVSAPGTIFLFPRAIDGSLLYRSIEGISWLGPDRIAAVSDRLHARPGEAGPHDKEQMLHIFDLPRPSPV